MRLASLLPARVRHLAPEAIAFAAVGAGNTVLYLVIFNLTLGIGAVKANVIATVVTTTLSYFANRHWTYRHRPKTALRREYTLFFVSNLVGMLIQAGVVFVAKYGGGLTEDRHRLALNVFTCIGIGLATGFRFWAYRTLVFRSAPRETGATPGALAGVVPGTLSGATPSAAASTPPGAATGTPPGATAGAPPHPRIGAPLPGIGAPMPAGRGPAGRGSTDQLVADQTR